MTTLEEVVEAYIKCALWAGLLDDNYGPDDLAPEAVAAITEEIASFLEANESDLEGLDPVMVGHDFYLTRNRHGAGFWDRGHDEKGERLTKAAHAYGRSDLYIDDDGRLYEGGY